MTDPQPSKRIVFVLNSLDRGGMELATLALACELAHRTRFRPVIACLAREGELAPVACAAGLEIHDGLLRHKHDLSAIGRLRRLFRGESAGQSAAAVVVVNPGGDRMFWSALARGRRGCTPPLICWAQETPQPGHRVIDTFNRLLLGRYDAFAALGPRQAEAYVRLERVPADRIRFLPNALATSQIEQLAARSTRDKVRAELSVGDGEILVLCVANDRPIKRIDLFCRAAANLRDHRPDLSLRFVLVGSANRDELQNLLAKLDLRPPTFSWLGPQPDVARLWPAADIGVCCSDSEGLSVAMLESMAARVPFVSTAVGEHPTVIEDGASGLLIPPGSADALADAIARLAGDSGLRQQMGERGLARVRNEYTVERSADRFEEILAGFKGAEARKV
jgi:glycosyltransferase involved in cell wall biosynthesis